MIKTRLARDFHMKKINGVSAINKLKVVYLRHFDRFQHNFMSQGRCHSFFVSWKMPTQPNFVPDCTATTTLMNFGFFAFEFFTIRVKNHHPNALPTEPGRNLLDRRFLKWALFVSCTISHLGLCSFLESIEHDFTKAMEIQAGNWMLT